MNEQFPSAQGLYDPQHEHDACGVGFVVDLKGRKSHDIVANGTRRSCSTCEHRGACGCEKNTGDGAGILMQMPHRFLAEECGELRHQAARGRALRRRHGLPAHRPGQPRRLRAPVRAGRPRRGADVPRLARRPDRQPHDRPDARSGRSRSSGSSSSAATRRRSTTTTPSSASSTSSAAARGTRCGALDVPEKAMFYIPSLSCTTIVYKGMLNPDQLTAFFPDLQDDRRRVGPGAGALALQHQHLPQLAARASLPLRRAQRRDQHAARQRQLDARPREHVQVASCSATTWQKCIPVIDTDGSDSAMFDNALELLVLAGRSLPHAMMMMIPEPWANHESMSAGTQGVLRVPRLPDGAVGRPGVDRLHRRHPHRRDARPQRPAPVALLRHQGRPGHHGVRGRRARHPAGAHPAEGPAAAGAHVPGRHRRRAASSPTRS